MESNTVETKVCPRCGRELPVTKFYKNKSRPDGLSSYCKECRKLKSKIYYSKNRIKILKNFTHEYRTNPKFRIEKLKYNMRYRYKNNYEFNAKRRERYQRKKDIDSYWKAYDEVSKYY